MHAVTAPIADLHAVVAPDAETILYFCYGPQELFDQAIFSILTLLRVAGDAKIVVYCDRPEAFAGLPVETVALDQGTLDHWLGESDYIHRRKTCVIIDALTRFGGKILFLDTDTYWMRSPAALFRHVGPGRACFHILEGYLQSTGTPSDTALARQLATHTYRSTSGEPVTLTALTPMWNTGVVGVDADDLPLMHDALALSDAIWADADPAGAFGRKVHHAEQFAMGHVFRNCRLREADACVYHYWPQVAKIAFGAVLPGLIASGIADSSHANLDRLYGRRYRRTGFLAWSDRAKMLLRKLAQAKAVPLKGVRQSI